MGGLYLFLFMWVFIYLFSKLSLLGTVQKQSVGQTSNQSRCPAFENPQPMDILDFTESRPIHILFIELIYTFISSVIVCGGWGGGATRVNFGTGVRVSILNPNPTIQYATLVTHHL